MTSMGAGGSKGAIAEAVPQRRADFFISDSFSRVAFALLAP